MCTKLTLFKRLYRDAWSTKHKILRYYLKNKPHMLKTYELPEDSQHLTPKRVEALTNK